MKVKRHWILYVLCLPWNILIAWPIVLFLRLFWGKDLRWETPPPYERAKGGGGGPCLTCQLREGSFPVTPGRFPRGWYYHKATNRAWGGTALGHAVFYGPCGRFKGVDWVRTQAHEHVHVEQFEVSMLRSFIVGMIPGAVLSASGHPIAALTTFLVVWTTGYLMMGAAGWLTAFLRGEEAYWGSTHEESARAQTIT